METQEKSTKVLEQIKTFRDRSRVKLNLAQKELSDSATEFVKELEKVEGHLKDFQQKLTEDKDEMRLQAHLAYMEARDRWEKISDYLEDVAHDLSQEGKSKVDHARLKAHLAKLEGQDFLSELKEKKSKVTSFDTKFKEEWYKFLTHVDERFMNVMRHFPLQ